MDFWSDRYLLNELGEHYKQYSFHCFTFGGEKYLFITKMKINFNSFLNEFGERKTAYLVEGALYDFKNHEFIDAPTKSSKRKHFFEFVIYDATVPHIVYDRNKDNYIIISLKEDFCFEEASSIDALVTQIYANNGKTGFRRAVFFTRKKYGKTTNKVIVYEDGMIYYDSEKDVEFKECIKGKSFTTEEQKFINNSLDNEYCRQPFCVDVETFDAINQVEIKSYLLAGDSCIIIESNYGVLGELSIILLGREILFDFNYSGFFYEVIDTQNDNKFKNHLVIRWLWRRNDFENGESFLDVTTIRIYDSI